MPRRDDEFDDDDRPRRRPRRDDDDDRPRRRRYDDEDDLPPRRQKKKSSLGLILGIVGGILFVIFALCGLGFWYSMNKVGDAADRMTSSNNLKQVGIGCLNYETVNNGLPTDSYGPDGKPLLSWRVHLLPFVEEDALYKQFKLNEPWDSPNNIKMLERMPMVYATPVERRGKVTKGNKTYYRGFTSAGAALAPRNAGRAVPNLGGLEPPFKEGIAPMLQVPPPRGIRLMEITDGTSNTILAIEAGEAIEWTKPGDLDASPGKPFPSLGGVRPGTDEFIVLMVDGSTRFLKKTKSETELRAMVTCNGGEIVNLD
jgi:hypothetical protein